MRLVPGDDGGRDGLPDPPNAIRIGMQKGTRYLSKLSIVMQNLRSQECSGSNQPANNRLTGTGCDMVSHKVEAWILGGDAHS